MQYSDIIVSRDGKAGVIAISRPDVRNAVRAQTMDELRAALAEFVDDPEIRVIVFTSTGRHFVAGAEFSILKDLAEAPVLEVKEHVYRSFQGAARAIYHCPKPTLAAFSGAAITVGCELALACDFRIVSETAFFEETWIKLGLIPPLGGMMLLPRLVGLGVAADMILRGRRVGAEEALRFGLVHQVAAEGDLEETRRAFAAELAELPPQAYAAAKLGIQRGLESTMEKEWAHNVLAQAVLLGSEDFREGLEAIVSKRAPAFAGR